MAETTHDATVRSSRRGAVVTITLNRPHRRNAMDTAAWALLGDALVECDRDPEVRAVVLTGEGTDFCAGADLGRTGGAHPLRSMAVVNDTAVRLHELTVPTIAKVRGAAVGAGWNLALACDLVAADRTARFSQIFSRRGLSVDLGGSWSLPRLVGLQQAKRLALLAEMIDVDEAARLGLVTYVCDPEDLDAHVGRLADQLAAGPPIALAQSKSLLNAGVHRTMREALDAESRAQTINVAGTDAPAAFAAFAEHREATFTGGWER